MPAERGGIMPTSYEFQEHKNWRGISKLRVRFVKRLRARYARFEAVFKGYALCAAKPVAK
jgi:hypothetical protein